MKKYLYLLFVALFATMSFALTSCSNDDEPSAGGDIVGSWENVTDWATLIGKQYVKFESDGTYYEINEYASDGEVEVLKAKWKKDGNTLKVFGSKDMQDGTATISNLTDNTFTITAYGISQDYKRVSDSVLDKYIK